jgi:azurin
MKKGIVAMAMLALVFTACGSEEPKQAPTEEPVALEAPVEEVAAVAEITIEANDQMKYNLDRIDVKEGQMVKLTLKNVGKLPKEAMGHNWVLVKPGTDKEAFATAAVTAKETDYIPAGFEENLIVYTILTGGGEETTIEFEAPAKGFYSYFCSFPGHYASMKGTFYVN